MKFRSIYFYSAILFTIFWACGGHQGEKTESGEPKEVAVVEGERIDYIIDTTNSLVEWTGATPTSEHNGTIN